MASTSCNPADVYHIDPALHSKSLVNPALFTLDSWSSRGNALLKTAEELGYYPSSLIGMGQDLTLGMGRDWRRWQRHVRYSVSDHQAAFDSFQKPLLAFHFLDEALQMPRLTLRVCLFNDNCDFRL